MSRLSIDQKSILELFSDKRSDFLIPDYQRPYAWGESECQTLWDDIVSFALPDGGKGQFNRDEEYYLGPIVTFKNPDGKLEIIDGQQRLTTLMLLLRAFYQCSMQMVDQQTTNMRKQIEQCIWKTDEFGQPDLDNLKINSEVATDEDKDEFLSILKLGSCDPKAKSRYAQNYRFFIAKIEQFKRDTPSYFPYLPARILNNCILLPIEAVNQDTALRIFSTLNDRGKPLADADIFKAESYKYYSGKGKKDEFIDRWKALEREAAQIFRSGSSSPLDELFTLYMYYRRACEGNANTTTEALRKFYERDSYILLKDDTTLSDLELLLHFWTAVSARDASRFSDRILRKLFILRYAPNGMWRYLLSVYFLHHHKAEGKLDEEALYRFLDRSIGFIWAYTLTNPGVNALRTPLYREMISIIEGKEVTFSSFKFDRESLEAIIDTIQFTNQRQITRSMLTWWVFENPKQQLPAPSTRFDIEHIYARNRAKLEELISEEDLELLGNKSLLEQAINVRASDYRFSDKVKVYMGRNGSAGTSICELRELCSLADFSESDILERNQRIVKAFIDYLDRLQLLLE